MKTLNLKMIGGAVLAALVLTSAQAAGEIPLADRQKAAAAVTQLFGAAVPADAVKATSLPGVYQVRMSPGPVCVAIAPAP